MITHPDRVEPFGLDRPRNGDHFRPGHRTLDFRQLDSDATWHRASLIGRVGVASAEILRLDVTHAVSGLVPVGLVHA